MSPAVLSTRALGAARGTAALVAVVVALLAGALTAWPRLQADAFAEQTRYRVAETTSTTRDVRAQRVLGQGDGFGSWPELTAALERLRDDQPAPLRDVLAPAELVATTRELALPVNEAVDVRSPQAVLAGAPDLADRVTLVRGEWPGALVWDPPAAAPPGSGPTPSEQLPDAVVDVVVADESAALLGWDLGEVLATPSFYVDLQLRLVGTYEIDDPDSTYWDFVPGAAGPGVVADLNAGTSVTAYAFTDPAGWWSVLEATREPVTTNVRYEVTPDAIQDADPGLLATQLRAFLSQNQPLRTDDGVTLAQLQFGSELPGVLEEIAAENAASTRVVALVAVGPLAVGLTVLVLLARAMLARRRAALALLSLRGASGARLRAMLAVEGVALGVPAAALGAPVAVLLTPGGTG
ncbi:MAG TPA: hypothetical protein DHV14_01775, partial [Micrococcales bacterium]|uniref:hypothetical protein n=1 Tax=Miniimonas arenae TaxID=676201 RepID=UPI000EDF2FBE|nr:hypothetical protein [Micrococcales bacterium]